MFILEKAVAFLLSLKAEVSCHFLRMKRGPIWKDKLVFFINAFIFAFIIAVSFLSVFAEIFVPGFAIVMDVFWSVVCSVSGFMIILWLYLTWWTKRE